MKFSNMSWVVAKDCIRERSVKYIAIYLPAMGVAIWVWLSKECYGPGCIRPI